MGLPRRDPARSNSNLPLLLGELFGRMRLLGFNSADPRESVGILVENDGTIRQQTVLWDYTGAAQIRAAGEPTTGEAHVLNHGKTSGSAVKEIKVETTGEPDIVLHGKDSGGNIDPLLTNADKALIVDATGGAFPVQVDPQLVPAVEADLWDPGADAGDIFDVEFLIVNIDPAASVDVTVGQDVGGGDTALTDLEKFMDAEIVPSKASSGWRGPFRIGGDDHIRGLASAADDATVHFRITKVLNV